MQNAFKTLISGILETVKSYKGDWNENDVSSPNHIKNRTHYTHEGEIVLFDFDDVYSSYPYDFSEPLEFEKEYIIIVDGEKYNCTVCYDEYDESYYIGAPYDYDNDIFDFSEYPFYFWMEDLNYFYPNFNDVATFDTEYYGTPHTVRISRIGEIVETIDKKFLPENLGEVVADALPGGVGYIIPAGTVLVDTVLSSDWLELSKRPFLVPDWYYYVNYEGYYKGYVESYTNEYGGVSLGDWDQHGFELNAWGNEVYGNFNEVGLHFSVRTDDDLLLKINSQFVDVQLPEGIVTQDNIANNLPSNVVTIDEISKVATTGSYDDLKFKPCGIETTRTNVAAFTASVSSTDSKRSNIKYNSNVTYNYSITAGQLYEVIVYDTINNSPVEEIYSFRAMAYTKDSTTYLGNAWLASPKEKNTNEFLCLARNSYGGTKALYVLDDKLTLGRTTQGFRYVIYEITEGAINPLDERIIPDSFVKKEQIYPKEEGSVVVTWDKIVDGRDSFTLGNSLFVKVSDPIMLQSDVLSIEYGNNTDFTKIYKGEGVFIYGGGLAIVDYAGDKTLYNVSTGGYTNINIPSEGIYFYCGNIDLVNGYLLSATITYNKKFLPFDVKKVVKTINNVEPDESGNVQIEVGGGSSGGVYPIFIDRNVSSTIPSYDDMVAAINAGQLVFVVYKSKSGNFTTYVMSSFDPSSDRVYFSTLLPHTGNCDELVIYNTGVSSVDGYTVTVTQPK